MPLSFFTETVTRKRAQIKSKNGMDCQDWQNAEEITISNVQVTPAATSRDFDERTLNVSDRRTLRAGYDADIMAGDRIVWNGTEYDIDGEVFHTKSPTGRISTTRCTLVRFKG